jgi:hypothetical protein
MFNWLNKDTLQGVIRGLLTFGGGMLVAKGKVTQEQLTTLTGYISDPQVVGFFTLVSGIVWSVIHKQQTPPATPSTTTTTNTIK